MPVVEMDDKKIVKDIVTGTISMDELHDKILHVFMEEIKAELMNRTPRDQGNMNQHWHERRIGRTQIEFSNSTAYLPFHITGTGLYGPKHQMICCTGMSKLNPKRPHVMAWRPKGRVKSVKGASDAIYRRCTKGMHPNPFITESIEAGIENGCETIIQLFGRADREIS